MAIPWIFNVLNSLTDTTKKQKAKIDKFKSKMKSLEDMYCK